LNINAAPTCTVGPSRPIVKPPRIARNDTAILPPRMRKVSRRAPDAEVGPFSTRMTCGMPLPSEPRKNVRVSHTESAATAGVISSGNQTCSCWAVSKDVVAPVDQARIQHRDQTDRDRAQPEIP